MPHSILTMRLRAEVHESELQLQANIGYMMAFGALHAHPHADIDKAAAKVNKLFMRAIGSIPYLTGGKSPEELQRDERLKAVEKYKKMQDRLT